MMNRPFNKIEIEFIPHDKQRYPTCGDWRIVPGLADEKILLISVSKLSDWRFESLIAFHELAEVLMCEQAGVTQEMVDKFDKEFESHRHPDNEDEPGDDPNAPYRKQHCVASGMESILAAELGVVWKEYSTEVLALP